MPKGNLIEVSFGKPSSAREPCCPVAKFTDLTAYKKDRNGGFLEKFKVNMVSRARHALVVNFTVDEDSRTWLLEHESLVRQYMNRVRLIHVTDRVTGEVKPFITDEDSAVALIYPEGQAGHLRVYFFLSSDHDLSKEEAIVNGEITLFVPKN